MQKKYIDKCSEVWGAKSEKNGGQKLDMAEVGFKGKETQNPRGKPQTQALKYQSQTKINITHSSVLN